ncbi:hypothetical protein DY000_02005423 [Brassica cretica]|uniref:Uncharacterized protein n=1 Tax=Brassica cretica TaxID=69181 RepID=A0ABQ7C625_BRACR|nr:hypothetical protein DY000_02005423 [Brassica cretica]
MKVSTGLSQLAKTRICYNIQKKWTSCRSLSPYSPAHVAPQRSGESRSLQDCSVQTSQNQPNAPSMNSRTTSTTSKEHRLHIYLILRTGEAVRIVNQHANRRFYICCNKEVELLPLRELPSPLKELLDAPMFRVLICVANGMIAFTSSGAHVDHIITGKPGQSFTEYMVKTNTVSVHS